MGYISQLLSNFDYENDCYLDTLIYQIAKKYPNALYFPFKMSYENYKRSTDRGMQKELIAMLLDLIENPLMENFTSAIKRVCLSKNMLVYHVDDLMVSLSNNREKFADQLDHVLDIVYGIPERFNGADFDCIAPHERTLRNLRTLEGSIVKSLDFINEF